ncbi:MAG: septal ring lytic transglycosylase RlpA family protein [Candidatus Kapaibacterium sp.]|nr:septal ring lytic transglycosylase RlpA family protein [Bacteroidota bacterium]
MPGTKTIFKNSIKFGVVVGLFFISIISVLLLSGSGIAGASEPIVVKDITTDTVPAEESVLLKKVQCSFTKQGQASYYGNDFHGKSTANGQRFDMNGFTAAHRTLPFGTVLRITNPDNKTSIIVLVNDRGPFVGNREVDMAEGAARAIDVTLNKVTIEGFSPRSFYGDSVLIGFSAPSYEAFRLPISQLNVLDTVGSFSDAIRIHRTNASKFTDQQVYLIIAPTNHGARECGYQFIIATNKVKENTFNTAELLTE